MIARRMVLLLTFKTELMSHQQEAYNKLQRTKVGALFMEMGTGKTRTALELSVERLNDGKVDCILWLCPVSVKQTIANEVEKHLENAEYKLVDSSPIQNWQSDIYITGIESMSQSDKSYHNTLKIIDNKEPFIVLDESSFIKNKYAKRTKRIWRLGEHCEYKLILNGTPISNNEQDLYCQWYFLDYRILGYTSYHSFAANHLEFHNEIPGYIVRTFNIDHLVSKMSPYLYQIKKEECLDLPKKTYSTRYFNLPFEQWNYYQWQKNKVLDKSLSGNWDASWLFELFSMLQKIISGLKANKTYMYDKIEDDPRIQTLLSILKEIPDKKVIIWCRYKHEIENICKLLRDKGNKVAEFWGEVSQKQRDEELEKFRNDTQYLVANKMCGAFGLNLQFCNYVIYYSNDFSWETRSQSEDRVHRQGQENKVHYIDVIARNTIDERIYQCLQEKESLVENFKREIDKQKDTNKLGRWIDCESENSKTNQSEHFTPKTEKKKQNLLTS